MKLYLAAFLIFSWLLVEAQQSGPLKVVEETEQFWIGYMTSTQFAPKYSLWNDFHYATEGFLVLRTGITRHFLNSLSITGGFAFARLPMGPANPSLQRKEYRPWAQILFNSDLGNGFGFTNRIRYDMRFREVLLEGLPIDNNYVLTHRMRYLVSFQKKIPEWKTGQAIPFISVANEVLVNFGEYVVYNHLDQNRLSFTVGFTWNQLEVRTGYMNRFVQLPVGNEFVTYHTLILWFSQRFKTKDFDERQRRNEIYP